MGHFEAAVPSSSSASTQTERTTCDPDNLQDCDISLFGAFITSVSANYSWGQSGASLSVSLIEGPAECDGEDNNAVSFCPPKLGSPVCLNLSCEDNEAYDKQHGSSAQSSNIDKKGWKYIGILDSWDQTEDANSGTRYEVRLTDPVQIVDGYQIILDGYDGQIFGVRNLCNLKGFLMGENGPLIMNRVLDNCGCDPIYPSEFVKNIGSGIPGHGELEARAHLYNKLGLKWQID